MSGLGLRRLGRLAARRVRRVALLNARRGFGKAAQHGDRLAMVLEPLAPARPIVARPLRPEQRGDPAQAILIDLAAEDLRRIAQREGYAATAFDDLTRLAAAAGDSLPAYLRALLAASGGDIGRYRRELRVRLDYTSPHYIPHPVDVAGELPALTFLAPGDEGSGAADVVAVRVASGHTELLDIAATWRLKPNPAQLEYFATCVLAALHGVRVDDVAAPLVTAAPLRAALRAVVDAHASAEIDHFRAALGLSAAAYRAFAAPADLLYSQLFST
jgi:hypothetical protein